MGKYEQGHESNVRYAESDLLCARKVSSSTHNSKNLDAIARKYYYDNIVCPRIIRNSGTTEETLLFLLDMTLHKTRDQSIMITIAEQCGRLNTATNKSAQALVTEMVFKSNRTIRLIIAKATKDPQILQLLIKRRPSEPEVIDESSKRLMKMKMIAGSITD